MVLHLLIINPFFKNTGPYKIENLLKLVDLKNSENLTKDNINDIKDLSSSGPKDITFFHSKKYSNFASKTKAIFCITFNMNI